MLKIIENNEGRFRAQGTAHCGFLMLSVEIQQIFSFDLGYHVIQ